LTTAPSIEPGFDLATALFGTCANAPTGTPAAMHQMIARLSHLNRIAPASRTLSLILAYEVHPGDAGVGGLKRE
jgi:hypothetical protein